MLFRFILLGPVVHATSLVKPLLIPVHILQRLDDTHFQDTPRRLGDALVEKTQVLVQQQVRAGHDIVAFGDEAFLMLVFVAKQAPFLVGDEEAPRVAERVLGAVFLGHDEHLEDLPAERLDPFDGRVHVFLEIVPVDDGVDFEHDAVLLAHFAQVHERFQVVAGASPDLDVGLVIEGVARDGHDIEVLAVLGQPSAGHLAAVGDHGHGFESQGFFAVLDELAEELSVHKGLAARKIDLLHARRFKERHAFFGVGQGFNVRCLGRVKAESCRQVSRDSSRV